MFEHHELIFQAIKTAVEISNSEEDLKKNLSVILGGEANVEGIAEKIREAKRKIKEKKGVEIRLTQANIDNPAEALTVKQIRKKTVWKFFLPETAVKAIGSAFLTLSLLTFGVGAGSLALILNQTNHNIKIVQQQLKELWATAPYKEKDVSFIAPYKKEAVEKGIGKLYWDYGLYKLFNLYYFSGGDREMLNVLAVGYYFTELDPYIVLSFIASENTGKPSSPKAIRRAIQEGKRNLYVSHMNAVGLSQITPPTFKDILKRLPEGTQEFVSTLGVDALNNPYLNLLIAYIHIDYLVEKFQSIERAAIAYNCGEGCLKREKLPEETMDYIKKVREAFSVIKNAEGGVKSILYSGMEPRKKVIVRILKPQKPPTTLVADSSRVLER